MNSAEMRWIEIRFYYICQSIVTKTNSIQQLIEFMDGMKFLKPYNALQLRTIYQALVHDTRFPPNKSEVITLGRTLGVPAKLLMSYLKLTRMTIHRRTLTTEDFVFRPILAKGDIEIVQDFLNAIDFIKENL